MSPSRRAVLPALLLAVLPVAPAAAAEHGDPVLLALGDSVAAGEGAVPFVTGYPELVGSALSEGYNPAAGKATPNAATSFDVVNLARSGATTQTLLADEGQVDDAVALIEDRRADRDPKNDVEVVTLTIGGNDVFGPVAAACVVTASALCQVRTDAALAKVRTGVTTALAELTAAAGKHVEVVVTTYYNPIGACFLTGLNPDAPAIADVVLEGGTQPGLLTVEAGLNDIIRQAAEQAGAQVAELSGALEPTDVVGGLDCLHPNARGHRIIADEVVATLAR